MFTLESNKMIAFWANENLTFTFYVIISYCIPNITTLEKEVFDSMFGLESDEMTHSQVTYQTEQVLEKKFFDLTFSLESDKMTA